jgi:uncharacterized repeat protein (TIGR03803 family)
MKNFSRLLPLALLALSFVLTTTAFAQFTITDLHNFGSVQNDGSYPQSAPIMDSAGNLYGVTTLGGAHSDGMAYELSPSATGWTYTDIYDFGPTGAPSGGLILDASGNLYGVTHNGGTDGLGVVYELSPSSSGWTQTVLYSFTGNSFADGPRGTLLFDASGNLYGFTNPYGYGGTVYELSPSSSGWTKQVLYTFTDGTDGANPQGNLLMDSAGRIYGGTDAGGSVTCSCGTIFRLTPSSGVWHFDLLYTFQGLQGGRYPNALVFDSADNIYGTASGGGSHCKLTFGCGVVFKLTPPPSGGPWREKVLHAFANQLDGSGPSGAAFDAKGNLYGTSLSGATLNDGVVWELTPTTTGPWKFTQVVAFGKENDGYNPYSGVMVDSKANLYGTCYFSSVFEISPQ